MMYPISYFYNSLVPYNGGCKVLKGKQQEEPWRRFAGVLDF
jgi:hypothetical protein